MLVVPINKNTKRVFDILLINEEKKWPLVWKTDFFKELEVDDFVFFPEIKKLVRIYKIKEIQEGKIILSQALGEVYFRDWIYPIKDHNPIEPYLVEKEKRLAVINLFGLKKFLKHK